MESALQLICYNASRMTINDDNNPTLRVVILLPTYNDHNNTISIAAAYVYNHGGRLQPDRSPGCAHALMRSDLAGFALLADSRNTAVCCSKILFDNV